jgi:hypothetical protein
VTAAADPRKLADIVLEARKWAAELRAQEGLQSTPAGLAPLLDALVSLAEDTRMTDSQAARMSWLEMELPREREARVSAERERDEAKRANVILNTRHDAEQHDRISAEAALRAEQAEVALAQARAEELEKALRRIIGPNPTFDPDGQHDYGWENEPPKAFAPRWVRDLANDALVLAASPQAGPNHSNEIDKAIWLAAIDVIPIEDRVEWTRKIRAQYDHIAAQAGEHTERKAAAEQELCRAADAYVWEPTDETMEALRDARAEWQTAVGLWRLARRQAGEHQTQETTT